jgi:hypothetical protein
MSLSNATCLLVIEPEGILPSAPLNCQLYFPWVVDKWHAARDLETYREPFEGNVDYEVVGKVLQSGLEVSNRHLPWHTQAGSRFEEHAARHRGTCACSLEFVNIDAALGQRMREVSDNPRVVIADQVEHEPAGLWRRGIGAAARNHHLESM